MIVKNDCETYDLWIVCSTIQFQNYLLDQQLLLQLEPVAVLQLDDPVVLHQAGAAVAVVGGPVESGPAVVRRALVGEPTLCLGLDMMKMMKSLPDSRLCPDGLAAASPPRRCLPASRG